MNELEVPTNNTIINVTNFGVNMTNDRLRRMFEKYGTITSYGILNNDEPWRRFAFVAFDNSDAADEAVIEMNGQSIDDNRRIRVRRTTKREKNNAKEKRTNEEHDGAKNITEETFMEMGDEVKLALNAIANFNDNKIGFCVYVKNLDKNVDRAELRQAFQYFGPILEAKVIYDNTDFSNRPSKGYGFVTFAREESAQRAIREKSGRLIGTQIVHVEMSRGPRWLRDGLPNRAGFGSLQRYQHQPTSKFPF